MYSKRSLYLGDLTERSLSTLYVVLPAIFRGILPHSHIRPLYQNGASLINFKPIQTFSCVFPLVSDQLVMALSFHVACAVTINGVKLATFDS